MADQNNQDPTSSDEYKKATEELYKRNVELAELYKKVESLNKDLEEANTDLKNVLQQRESLVHLITHKVKGAFTRTKYIFAEMIAGTFGPLSDEMKRIAEKGLESDAAGIQTIDLVLNAANLESGIVKYDMQKISLREIVQAVISEKMPAAEVKGLKVISNFPENPCMVVGDVFWLKEVVSNLVDNSIKYTREGEISVSLSQISTKTLLQVKDTGVGISAEDKKNLFTEGGRGKESIKLNVDSTGYGLFSVKLIIDAHGGRVWAESEGPGKGSQFFVEIDSA